MGCMRRIHLDMLLILNRQDKQATTIYHATNLSQGLGGVAGVLQGVRTESPVNALVYQILHILQEGFIGADAICPPRMLQALRIAIHHQRLDGVCLEELIGRIAVIAAEVGYCVIVVELTSSDERMAKRHYLASRSLAPFALAAPSGFAVLSRYIVGVTLPVVDAR